MEQSKNETNDWPSDAVVALIEWLPNLTKTTMPIALRDFVTGDSNVKQPLDVTSSKELAALDENILTQLVQWSDLIIFDYLTGNYDRVASMQVIFQNIFEYTFKRIFNMTDFKMTSQVLGKMTDLLTMHNLTFVRHLAICVVFN